MAWERMKKREKKQSEFINFSVAINSLTGILPCLPIQFHLYYMWTFTYNTHIHIHTLHIIINYSIITVVAIKWIILIVNIRRPTKFVRFAHILYGFLEETSRNNVSNFVDVVFVRMFFLFVVEHFMRMYVIFNVARVQTHIQIFSFFCRVDLINNILTFIFLLATSYIHEHIHTNVHKIGNRNLVKLSSLTFGEENRKKKQTEKKINPKLP